MYQGAASVLIDVAFYTKYVMKFWAVYLCKVYLCCDLYNI